jgi:hypothetical protein
MTGSNSSGLSTLSVQHSDHAKRTVQRPVDGPALILEAWSQGLMTGSLVIMAAVTYANMRPGVLLHKLIVLEVALPLSMWNIPTNHFLIVDSGPSPRNIHICPRPCVRVVSGRIRDWIDYILVFAQCDRVDEEQAVHGPQTFARLYRHDHPGSAILGN